MHDPHDPPQASQPGPRPAETHPMRFAVTCWVADAVRRRPRRRHGPGDPAPLPGNRRRPGHRCRRDRGHRGRRPGRTAHLRAITAALEHDGQAVNTAGEPDEADAATDYTVEVLIGDDDADPGQGAAPGGSLAGLLAEARHALAGLAAPAAGNGLAGEAGTGHDVAEVLWRLAAELDESIPSASGHGPVTSLFTRGEAGCPDGPAPGTGRPAAIAGARFTLDEARARTWLRHAVAACMTDLYGDEPPADLGPRPAGELPEIGNDWNPVSPGEEDEVFQLVRRAVDSNIIGKPAGDIDLDFEYVADSDGGYYYFLVRLGWKLKLATHAYEMRKLGRPAATGIEAALAILDEAVTSANSVLDALDEKTAAQGGIVLARARLARVAGLGRDLTGHELAPAGPVHPPSSIPNAVGTIVSDAMGLTAGERRPARLRRTGTCPASGWPPREPRPSAAGAPACRRFRGRGWVAVPHCAPAHAGQRRSALWAASGSGVRSRWPLGRQSRRRPKRQARTSTKGRS